MPKKPTAVKRTVKKPVQKKTKSELTLETVIAILFPPLIKEKMEDGRTMITDSSIDNTLQTCIYDIQDNIIDEHLKETMDSLVERLAKVRTLLGAEQKITHVDVLKIESRRFER